MPLEFFAPGIFIEEVPWRARPMRATASVPSAASRESIGEPGLLVPDQPVMLVVKNRRDGPWSLPFGW
jgi:hypothetical protein